MKITLTKPLSYKDTELDTLDLDLGSLTGRDLLDTEEALKRSGVSVAAWEFSRTFLLSVAARSLHIPAEVLKGLSASDFTKLINEVLSFLAGQDSGDLMPQSSGS